MATKKQKKFEFLDITTADVAFLAFGKDLNEVFANAALAMFEVMIDTSQVKPTVKKDLTVRGNDLESLLFNWLNELLVFVDAENLVFSQFDVKVYEKELKLEAACKGERIDKNKHETRTAVKAVTYHQLKIKKEKGLWKAQLILDI